MYKPSHVLGKKVFAFEKKWTIIRDEVLNLSTDLIQEEARHQEDWYGSDKLQELSELHQKKSGWIKSWSGQDKWINYGLVYNGQILEANVKNCPQTNELLKEVLPYIRVAGFSKMLPGCILPPHRDACGLKYGSLAYHLGLSIPGSDACFLISENEKIGKVIEKNGQSFMFDPTYVHYAENQSDESRYILYMDIDIRSILTKNINK